MDDMTRLWACGCAVAIVALLGAPALARPTVAASRTPRPVVLDDAALYAASLTTADFPATWHLVQPESAAGAWVVDPTGGPCGTPNSYGRARALNAKGAVLVAFTPDPAPLPQGLVYQDLYSFHARSDAQAYVQRDPACTEWTWEDDTWTYAQDVRVDGPITRVHWWGGAAPGTVDFDEVFVTIRVGSHVVTVGESRWDGTMASEADVEHYGALASERLRSAIAAARRSR